MAKAGNIKSINFFSKKFLEKNLKKFKVSKDAFKRINIHSSDSDLVHIMLMFYKKNLIIQHITQSIKLNHFQL